MFMTLWWCNVAQKHFIELVSGCSCRLRPNTVSLLFRHLNLFILFSTLMMWHVSRKYSDQIKFYLYGFPVDPWESMGIKFRPWEQYGNDFGYGMGMGTSLGSWDGNGNGKSIPTATLLERPCPEFNPAFKSRTSQSTVSKLDILSR